MASTDEKELIQQHKGYMFGVSRRLAESDLEAIIRAIAEPQRVPIQVLGGRGVISVAHLSDGTDVVIKHYRRGGILKRLVDRQYVRVGKVRPRAEFDLMQRVREIGVNAPRPVAWVTHGSIVYQGWFLTEMVQGARSLAQLSTEEPTLAAECMEVVAKQVRLLVDESICHVDFHPGNVLVDNAGVPFLIDFDKAYVFKGRKNRLRDMYLCRWRRAVLKHELPEFLVERMCSGVLQDFDASVSISMVAG